MAKERNSELKRVEKVKNNVGSELGSDRNLCSQLKIKQSDNKSKGKSESFQKAAAFWNSPH